MKLEPALRLPVDSCKPPGLVGNADQCCWGPKGRLRLEPWLSPGCVSNYLWEETTEKICLGDHPVPCPQRGGFWRGKEGHSCPSQNRNFSESSSSSLVGSADCFKALLRGQEEGETETRGLGLLAPFLALHSGWGLCELSLVGFLACCRWNHLGSWKNILMPGS